MRESLVALDEVDGTDYVGMQDDCKFAHRMIHSLVLGGHVKKYKN